MFYFQQLAASNEVNHYIIEYLHVSRFSRFSDDIVYVWNQRSWSWTWPRILGLGLEILVLFTSVLFTSVIISIIRWGTRGNAVLVVKKLPERKGTAFPLVKMSSALKLKFADCSARKVVCTGQHFKFAQFSGSYTPNLYTPYPKHQPCTSCALRHPSARQRTRYDHWCRVI